MAFKTVCQLHLLQAATRQLDTTYLALKLRFLAISATVKDNPLVHFTHRETCTSEFSSPLNERSTTASTATRGTSAPHIAAQKYTNIVHQLHLAAADVASALRRGDMVGAMHMMGAVDFLVDAAENRIVRLEQAVGEYELVTMFLRRRGLLG